MPENHEIYWWKSRKRPKSDHNSRKWLELANQKSETIYFSTPRQGIAYPNQEKTIPRGHFCVWMKILDSNGKFSAVTPSARCLNKVFSKFGRQEVLILANDVWVECSWRPCRTFHASRSVRTILLYVLCTVESTTGEKSVRSAQVTTVDQPDGFIPSKYVYLDAPGCTSNEFGYHLSLARSESGGIEFLRYIKFQGPIWGVSLLNATVV